MRGQRTLLGAMGMLASSFGVAPLSAQMPAEPAASPSTETAIDPATIPLPVLTFRPDAETRRNYDKYFYFHRTGTDFATAYADLQECDSYARGLTYRVGAGGAVGGVLGSALGDAIADLVHGSAERRRQRRSIMRTCMRFKEYRAYGLPKSLWEEFNFEEGNARIEEARRQRLLQIQARVASGAQPMGDAAE